MRVVVTGAMGFVGINVVRELAAAGHHVIAVDVVAVDGLARSYLDPVSARVSSAIGDLSDASWDTELGPARLDAVVHAAAVTPLGEFEEQEAIRAADTNVVAVARVMRWAVDRGVQRAVHVSTGSVYGSVTATAPVDEDIDHRPEGVYGITKSAGERIARRLADLGDIQLAVARLSHVYGPMERPSASRAIASPIERWTRALIDGGPIAAPRDDEWRDFVHVRDVARAIRLLLERGGEGTFNVSSGVHTSEPQLLEHLRSIGPVSVDATTATARSFNPRRPPLDISRIVRAVGWGPEIGLEDGLRDYVAWRRDFEA